MEKPTVEEVKHIITDLILPVYEIERDMMVPLTVRRNENVAEHSWGTPMVACMLASRYAPELDRGKVSQLGQIHDLLERHADDTSVWDMEKRETKAAREAAAFERFKSDYAQYPWLIELIEEYESQQTAEAKFVNSVDKLMAVTTRLIDHEAGNHFYIDGVPLTLEDYKNRLEPTRKKAQSDPRVGEIYDEIYNIFLSHPDWFLPDPKS